MRQNRIFDITLSIGESCRTNHYPTERWPWPKFVQRCCYVRSTGETMAQYDAMDGSERGRCKDVGGFVGGVLRDGIRDLAHLESRTLLTLDLDRGSYDPAEVLDRVHHITGGAACVGYSTHGHRNDAPRCRIVVALARPLTPQEYTATASALIEAAGLAEYADACSTRPAQLFYWPSRSADAPWWAEHRAGRPWDGRTDDGTADATAAAPVSDGIEDPLLKDGWVGAFCRAYHPISRGIEVHLPHVYEKASRGRYKYVGSTSEPGLIIKDGGRFAYSNHTNTDAAADGHAHNIFDLCRIHLAGGSMQRMLKIAENDTAARAEYFKAKVAGLPDMTASAGGAGMVERPRFAERPVEDIRTEVLAGLNTTKSGTPRDLTCNAVDILTRDPLLRGMLRYDLFSESLYIKPSAPWYRTMHQEPDGDQWTAGDDAALSDYVSRYYEFNGSRSLGAGLLNVAHRDNFHPIREYLERLKWDGTPRAASSIIRFLGAEDTAANREMTLLFLTGAVARVMRPGCKFDYMLILRGGQGTGKSTFCKVMFGDWFSDSLIIDGNKDAMVSLRGVWGFELGEMAGMNKADMNVVKRFISAQSDRYRAPYGVHNEDHPRQCVFMATTNEDFFLKDDENRRFMLMSIDPGLREHEEPGASLAAMRGERDQIWAEVVHLWKTQWSGRELVLSSATAAVQRERNREAHMDRLDPVANDLAEYLSREIPEAWNEYSKAERRRFYELGEARRMDGVMFEPRMMERRRFALKAFLWEYYGVNNEVEAKRKHPSLGGNLAKRIARMLREHGGWGEPKPMRDKVYGVLKGYEREISDEEL